MNGVQCYELFGGIALKNHAFSFFFKLLYKPFFPFLTYINAILAKGKSWQKIDDIAEACSCIQ